MSFISTDSAISNGSAGTGAATPTSTLFNAPISIGSTSGSFSSTVGPGPGAGGSISGHHQHHHSLSSHHHHSGQHHPTSGPHHAHLLQRFFSGHHGVEVTPSQGIEYCLDTTFSRFIALSDSKLEVVLHQSTDREIDLARYLQQGVDVDFDSCMKTLGSLAKHAPVLAINTLMAWRDSAGDLPETAPQTPMATVSSIRGSMRGSVKTPVMEPSRDIRLIASNIIFCRTLIEIIRSVTPETMKEDIGLKCEELAFNQLRLSIPDLIRNSGNWYANASYFARVLGELSATRFTSVTDRYLRELEKLAAASMVKEGKAEHIVFGLKFIQIKLYPMDALDDTADFLDSLGHFFLNTVDTSIRQAFLETFVELLSPLCEVITAEVNVPTWVAFVESVFPKVQKMALRPRHQTAAFSLLACLLSISRPDFFSKNWMAVMDMCQSKFKDRDRSLRHDTLKCVAQLLWVYLFRYSEPTATAQKRIAMLVKLLFPTGRRSINPLEVPIELFAYILYMIGVRYPVWTVANIMAPLVEGQGNPESAWSADRMSIAIEAMNWLINASAAGESKPPFPLHPLPTKVTRPQAPLPEVKDKHKQAFLQPVSNALHRIFDVLHGLVGGFHLDDEKSRAIVPLKIASPSGSNLYADFLTVRSTGSTSTAAGGATASVSSEAGTLDPPVPTTESPAVFIATIPASRLPFLELLKVLVSSTPRLIPFYETERLIDLLCSYATHIDRALCDKAMAALGRMAAETPVPVYQDILLTLEPRVFATSDRKCDLLVPFYVRASEDPTAVEQVHRGVLEIYAEVFERGKAHTRQLPLDALGLYLLCAPSVHVRRIAIQILEHVRSVVIDLLKSTNLFAAATATTRAGLEEWAVQFPELMSYCVDFLPRDSVKKAVQVALDRTNVLLNVLSPPDTGILWTTAVRSPPDESVVHWRRCATLVVLGTKYLSSPREVLATYLQLLGSDFTSVREAALASLAHTSSSHQGMLLDEMIPMIQGVADDARTRVGKRFVMPKKPGKIDRLRIEVPRLLTALEGLPTAALATILNYVRANKLWITDQRNNPEMEPVKLAFSRFVAMLYSRVLTPESIGQHALKLMDMRGQLFVMFADWGDDGPSAAWDAMAALLRGSVPGRPPPGAVEGFDRDQVLAWINSMLVVAERAQIGFRALVNLLEGNPSSKALHETVARTCFTLPRGDPIAQHYLSAFASVFRSTIHGQRWTVTSLETVLILGLVKLADDSHEIVPNTQLNVSANSMATAAILGPAAAGGEGGGGNIMDSAGRQRSRSSSMSAAAFAAASLKDQPQHLAVSKHALDMVQCLQDRLFLDLDVASVARTIDDPIVCKAAGVSIMERMVRNHPDWILSLLSELFFRVQESNVHVQTELLTMAALMMRYGVLGSDSELLLSESRFVVENLLYLTVTHSDRHAALLQRCWTNLVVDSVVNLKAVVSYFVQYAKDTRSDRAISFFRVILSFIHEADTTFSCILPYLTPVTFILFPNDTDESSTSPFFVPNLDGVVPAVTNRHPWSEGVVGTLLLAGVVPYMPPATIEQYLALFLEVSIAQLDHPDPFVAGEMKSFLCSLFQYDFSTFDDLDQVLSEIVQVLPIPLVDAWNSISLRWASNCTILHVAIKSLQMFRCSLRRANEDMLDDLLRLFISASTSSPNPAGGPPTHDFTTEILSSVLTVLSHSSYSGHPDSLIRTLQIMLQSMVSAPAEHIDLLVRLATRLLEDDPERVNEIDIGFITPYDSVSTLFLSIYQAHGHDGARNLINSLIHVQEPHLEWKPVLVLLANLSFMLGPNYADDVDEAYRQVVKLNHPTSKGLVKYLATWIKYRAKSQDDLMLQLSHALRDPYLSGFGEVILQGSLRFLSSLEPTVVQAHLMFLKHILPSTQISEAHVPPTYFAMLLDLTKDPKSSALALQVTDFLLKLMPTVSAEAQSRQAVLPSRSCTINKKKNRAGSALMQEWARINGGSSNNSRSRHSSAATALSNTGPRHLPTLPSSNSQVSRETFHSAAESVGQSATSHTAHSSVTAVNVASILSTSPPPRNRIPSSSQLSRPSSEAVQEEFPSLPRTVASGRASSSLGSRQLIGNTSEPFMGSNPALMQDSALNTSGSLPPSISPSDTRASTSSVASSAINSILTGGSTTDDDDLPSISRLGDSQSISLSLQSLAPVPEGKPLTTLASSNSQSSLLLVSQSMLNASLNSSHMGATAASDTRVGRGTTSSASSTRDPMGSNQSLVLIGSAPVSLTPNAPSAVTVLSTNGEDEDANGDGAFGRNDMDDDDVGTSTSDELASGSERPVTRLQAWVASDDRDARPLGSASLNDTGTDSDSDSDSDPGNESQVTAIDPDDDATAAATTTTLLAGGGDLGSDLELAGRTANDVNGSNLNLSMVGQPINDLRSSPPLFPVDRPATMQGAMSVSMLSLQSIPTSGSVASLGQTLAVDVADAGDTAGSFAAGDGLAIDQGPTPEHRAIADGPTSLTATDGMVVSLVPVAQPQPSLLTEDGQGAGGSLDSLVGQDPPPEVEATSTLLDDD